MPCLKRICDDKGKLDEGLVSGHHRPLLAIDALIASNVPVLKRALG